MPDVIAPFAKERTAARRARRIRADRWFRRVVTIATGGIFALFGLLLAVLVIRAHPVLTQTLIRVEFPIRADLVDPADPARGDYREINRLGAAALMAEDPADARDLSAILTGNTPLLLREAVLRDPSLMGKTAALWIPASDAFDQLYKGLIDLGSPENSRRVSDSQVRLFDRLVAEGRVTQSFNWAFLLRSDSRFPETAGLAGALVGTSQLLLVCVLLSVPVGLVAGLYLEEFTPQTWLSRFVEININTFAALPSILFGLFGLAVLIQMFGLPRSTPLVGGIVLGLMTLPRLIITTREALRSVPGAIREAAYGIGASRQQVVLNHVLPFALPAIVTGAAAGLTRALGETAPLLLIGMSAFVPGAPTRLDEATTALPTQIFIWAGSPEPGFVSRAAAAILILLGFLILIQGVATLLARALRRAR